MTSWLKLDLEDINYNKKLEIEKEIEFLTNLYGLHKNIFKIDGCYLNDNQKDVFDISFVISNKQNQSYLFPNSNIYSDFLLPSELKIKKSDFNIPQSRFSQFRRESSITPRSSVNAIYFSSIVISPRLHFDTRLC